MELLNKLKKYKEESGATYEQIARAIGVDPIKFRCFMFGKGRLSRNQIMMLDMIVSSKLGKPEEEENNEQNEL